MLGSLLLAALAQSTFLDEGFDSGSFPPAGWGELIRGAEPGWTQGLGAALHDDYDHLSDSILVTPAMDLGSAAAVYLHLEYGQRYPLSRTRCAVSFSLDGGVTWTELYALRNLNSGSGHRLELDLGMLAGVGNVRLGFHYEGHHANEWWLERVLVDDQPPVVQPPWPDLPTAFQPIRFLQVDFEALAGTVPAWMALNELDAATRAPDPNGWANLGQRAPVADAYDGRYALELGLAPTAAGPDLVANAMVIGVDGRGFDEADLVFRMKNHAEETHPDDGVFVSADGQIWFPVVTDWASLAGGSLDWVQVVAPLDATPVDISEEFYLAIAQSDDFPFGTTDGVVIDAIDCIERSASWTFEVRNPVAGQTCRLDVLGVERPFAIVQLLASTTGTGDAWTPLGRSGLGRPLIDLGSYVPDAEGNVRVPRFLPLSLQGRTVWTQVLEFAGNDGWFGEVVEVLIQ